MKKIFIMNPMELESPWKQISECIYKELSKLKRTYSSVLKQYSQKSTLNVDNVISWTGVLGWI